MFMWAVSGGTKFLRRFVLLCSVFVTSTAIYGQQVVPEILKAAEEEQASLIETMRELVSIESGSRDTEGLRRVAQVIADRFRRLGGDVEFVTHDDPYVMIDTPQKIGQSVVARFHGSGSGRILLLAHMDTVYLRGQLAEQPFRIADGRPETSG